MNTTTKILIVLSDKNELILEKGKSVKTGFFLSELMIPVLRFRAEGWSLVFANPSGVLPPMDPMSDYSIWFGPFNRHEYHAAKDLLASEMRMEFEGTLGKPRRLDSFIDSELQTFNAVFIPGGHAPLNDLGSNPHLGRILRYFHDNKIPIGSICHGPISLLSTIYSGDGQFCFRNYLMTAYSNKEERVNEMLWRERVRHKVEDELRNAGGKYVAHYPMMPHVVSDRELTTAQGPTSAWVFSDAFVHSIKVHSQAYSVR